MTIKKQFLTVFLICCLSMLTMAAHGEDAPSSADLKRMSTFLSNFTELGFMDLDAAELASSNPPADLIRFGVWHNYMNNYKSRIKPCKVKNCKWGSLTIEGKFVAESVKKYFGIDLKLVGVTESDPPYYYDGKLYHFEGADGEAVYYARVKEARADESGNTVMTGELYNTDDESDKLGTFKAIARPYIYSGKATWVISSIKTESGNEQAADEQAANEQTADENLFPVVIDGQMVGAFKDGAWLWGSGGTYRNGKLIDYDTIKEEDIEKLNSTGKFEMQRLKTGRRLAYFTPEGKVGNGVVTGAALDYTEAAGVEYVIQFDGYSPEYQKLIIGVGEEVNAVPAPTTRKEKDKGFVFFCKYKGVDYSVELNPLPNPKGDSYADILKGKLFVGGHSWDISFEDDAPSWPQEETPECGFFDLDGDGSLELAINFPGPNGSVYLFQVDAQSGAKKLSFVYTGAE